jgi:glycosyltransferase involved in cell wall biosynthesis
MLKAYDRRISREAGSTLGANIGPAERKPLRICFVVDARSPIALNWIDHFIKRGHSVHVISTYPGGVGDVPGASVYCVPLAFSRLGEAEKASVRMANGRRWPLKTALTGLRSGVLSSLSVNAHLWVTPFELHRHVPAVRALINQISPDLVHAMRIPFEGILAAKAAPSNVPLLISVWGNDFTLCAASNPLIARQTRLALGRADALHCDCRRDSDLAIRTWGFDPKRPSVVLPGAGGVQALMFHPGEPDSSLRYELNIPDDSPVVFNPRGFRGYVRNDVFFTAIPQVLKQYPSAVFVCAGMQSNPTAEKWVRQLAMQENVRLLPSIPRKKMAELFRLASVAVSPSLHDGTPNTLLEAMACGCFPVAGDIESVREWVTDKENGLLCDPTDPESLARAIIQALGDAGMRNRAREQNTRMIAERAEYSKVMQQAEELYFKIVQRKQAEVQV